MYRLFLSTSFITQVNHATGAVNPEFRKSIEQIIEALRDIDDLAVFCALEYEDWTISKEPPEVSIRKDIEEIRKADVVVALVPADYPSGGVQFEMGVAYALGKKVFAATEPDAKLNFLNQGAVNLGYIRHFRYKDAASLAKQVKDAL